MNICVICRKDSQDGTKIIQLREKGSIGINNASRERGDTLTTRSGDIVHEECRRIYVNPNIIKSLKRKISEPIEKSSSLRSEKQFSFKDDCLFCGTSVSMTTPKRKLFDVHAVCTTEFQKTVEQICKDRNDEWALEVKGRIEFARDLHAADSVYHKTCSSNFRTGKNIPQIFSPKKSTLTEKNRGRPTSNHQHFLQVLKYFEENDDEQVTVTQLVEKMQELCGSDAFSVFYMKRKLQEHYGSSVLITEINGKSNVVTKRQNASTILHNFFKESQVQRSDDENKMFIIKTAAEFIKSDIRSMPVDRSKYPNTRDISSTEKYIPNSLATFLKDIFSEKESQLKVNAIGQSIVQAARPRLAIQPLQIGLAVELHHMFGSRFLIDTLSNMGFCSSYSEVQRFESSAVVAQNNCHPPLEQSHFLQFVADNVDHNTDTIDGKNTFHGMGIISCISPEIEQTPKEIPRIEVSTEELLSCGHINILHYYEDQKKNTFSALRFKELPELRQINQIWKIDLLMKIVRPLRSPMPGWSGMMQMINQGNSLGVSNITFLPMIDLNPSDLSCIFSTLKFVSNEAFRHGCTPVITFDQPLYWKAVMISCSDECNDIIIRLGGFHTEMSFIGSIGKLMSGSGLKEVLELVYAPNAVTHMLNGKAVSRAVRGLMLVDIALHCLISEDLFGIAIDNENDDDDHDDDDDEKENKQTVSESPLLSDACKLFDKLLIKEEAVNDIVNSESFKILENTLTDKKVLLSQRSRTSKLWLMFCEMVAVLKRFLIAERTGDWNMHLMTVQEMLPYLAAAGHNLYTKSAYLYLSQMNDLKIKHPNVHQHFMNGKHVVRRSDRTWSGLSTDLAIEQVLMRNVKSTGGLTRGRGMGEAQRVQWLLSMPICAEYNSVMQTITGTAYKTSDQHVEASSSRMEKDQKDILVMKEFLKERNPFTEDKSLRNIETGMVANDDANPDISKDIGDKIINSMEGKIVADISFKRKDEVIPIGAKRPTNANTEQQPQVDPQLMFQRLTTAGQENLTNMSEIFKYELSSFPSSMFEANGLFKQAAKATLADAIWQKGNCQADDLPTLNVVQVIDGGSLIYRIPWTKGQTFDQICTRYVEHVKKRFNSPIVVLDGYETVSTKDLTHLRRSHGIQSNIVTFSKDMPLRMKKELFLQNNSNKQRFMDLLHQTFKENEIESLQSDGDADLHIVNTAILKSETDSVIVYGEDTDLLVLLCHHANTSWKNIFFTSDKQSAQKMKKIWDISKTKSVLGDELCKYLPFIHALTGCDTTSRLHGIGKPYALNKFNTTPYLKEQAELFMSENAAKALLIQAGEEALVCLYGGLPLEGLDICRWRKFISKTSSASRVSSVQVQSLPPTSDAAKHHLLRVYLQCQYWLGKTTVEMNPSNWGWTFKKGQLFPIEMTQPPAPEYLLKVIHCNCKNECENRRCSCRKNGLHCSNGCGECKGINCTNSNIISDEDINADDD